MLCSVAPHSLTDLDRGEGKKEAGRLGVIQGCWGHCYWSISILCLCQFPLGWDQPASSGPRHFPWCLLLTPTIPACPGTGRGRLSESSLPQAQAVSILSALAHPSVPPWGLRTSRLLPGTTWSARILWNGPRLIFPGASFTWTLHSWGPRKECVSLPFSLHVELICLFVHHVPSAHH